MDYARLAAVYQELERTASKLRKADIIAELLKACRTDELPMVTMLVQGRVFPAWSDREIGIAGQLMIKAIARITGFTEERVGREFKKAGDLGLVAESLIGGKRQATLFSRRLTVQMVFGNLIKVASVEGKGAQERKYQLVSEVLGSASPPEAKYIVRTVVGDLRIGVAEGLIRDSVAKAFFGGLEGEAYREAVEAIEWAWFLRPDYGEVASIARDGGIKALKGVGLEPGKPYMVQLAEKSPGLDEAVRAYERPAIEFKYDGARLSIHKSGSRVWLFTRRLENVTAQFPEVAEMARKALKARSCIIEGEMVGLGRDGRPLPFQFLSQRIKRKYEIEKVQKDIPVVVNLFDIVFLEGRTLFSEPLNKRWKALQGAVSPIKGRFMLARHSETRDVKEAGDFYREALASGHEGLIIKNLDAAYQPGRRVAGGWLKVKPTMENLDLVIMGATWGTGKRTGWLGSLVLGARTNEGFAECGMIGTGIKEKDDEGGVTFEMLTRLLKPHIMSEKGSSVVIEPRLVVEVAYEEIQKSPTYSSGYALRFPRVIRIRDDRRPEDCDTVDRIGSLFLGQKGKK